MFPTLSGHQILDKADFSSHGLHPTDLPSFPTERCSTHKAKILDMFCVNHNEVVCASCVALNHRACKDIQSVPEDIDNLYKQSTFEETKMKLKAMKKTTEDIKKTREQQLLVRELKKSKDEATDSIRKFRKEMEATLEKLERESIKVVEAEFERIETELLKQIKEANKFSDDLTLFITKLEKSAGNKAQEFVCVNQAVKTMDKTKEAEIHLRQEHVTELEFKPDIKIKTFLDNLKTLGQLTRTKYKPKKTAYTVRTQKEISVKLTEDRNDCCLYGSCFISDGSLLLTDFDNRKLKHVDISSAKVKNHIDLCAGPYAVCQTSDDEAAVSLSNETIQFVSLGHKMATTRQLKLDHHCYGLAHKEGKLYISDGENTVYIHDMSGTMLYKITRDRLGNEIFSSSIHISLGNKDSMYITDRTKGITTLDTQGVYKSTFKDPDIAQPWGVCTNRRGIIFVGSLCSSKIVQISEESKKKLGVLSTNKTNILSMCFYPQQNKLAVTGTYSTVLIYELE